jgi:DmsE family decaheme c-type cytochrome
MMKNSEVTQLYRSLVAAIFMVTAMCSQAWSANDNEVQKQVETAQGVPPEGVYIGTESCTDCHEGYVEQLMQEKHGQTADRRTPMADSGCESCHGPGDRHLEIASEHGEGGGLIAFRGEDEATRETESGMCLQCHQGGDLIHWQTSMHAADTMSCTACHSIHRPSPALDRATQSETCLDCHHSIRADIYRASAHPIREGNVSCGDCHNPHGSAGPSGLKELSVNENCYRCHAETRGPYLWEHYPVSEDCSLCHRVHGSNHASLLTKSPPFLCQQCHQDIRIEGQRHVRRFFDFDFSDTQRRSRFVLGEGCMNCHSQVHGSNHPSGAALMR